jgi:RNA polymerase sigma-70 factor (ECF subfamily)
MSINKPNKNTDEIPPDEDGELVRAAQKDPAAFQQLYDRWAVPIYQYFYARTGEAANAEDLTSQLFLSVYQALPRYQHRGTFAAWLFTIARNLSRDYYRKLGREAPLYQAQQLAADSDLPAEAAQREEIARLRRLIHSLPDREQELIRLRYVAGLTFAEMADVLKKRKDAVKKSLYRLQARLQGLLEQDHD